MTKEVNLQFSFSRPFGPPIGISSIPNFIIDKLNKFVDSEIENDKNLAQSLSHGENLAGQVKQEIKIPEDLIYPDLHDFLYNISKHYVMMGRNKEITKFEILQSWIVRQFENEYNPMHYHGGHLSGAGYIMLPKSFGESFQQNKKTNLNGHINFSYGVKQFLSNGHVTYKPKVGDFYLFPNYLFHSVNPFFGPGERRSISFNAVIDDNIYDVYS